MPTYETDPVAWAAQNVRYYADPEDTLVGASDIALAEWLESEAGQTPPNRYAVAYAEAHIRLEASVEKGCEHAPEDDTTGWRCEDCST